MQTNSNSDSKKVCNVIINLSGKTIPGTNFYNIVKEKLEKRNV